MSKFPDKPAFRCMHCGWPFLRKAAPVFACQSCKSRILIPEENKKCRELSLGDSKLRITSNNLPNRWGRHPFIAEDYNNSLLQKYRAEFPMLEKTFRNAKDEFAGIVALRHALRTEWLPKRPPDAFLKKYNFWTPNRLNKYWFCTHFARMFVLSAAAIGIPARILNVARGVKINEDIGGHMVVDVWSNQYQKWVYMDVLFDFHYEDSAGIPLSLIEARRLFFKNKCRGLHARVLNNYNKLQSGRYDLAAGKLTPANVKIKDMSLNMFWCLFYHGQNLFSSPPDYFQTRILRWEDDLTRGRKLVGNGREHYTEELAVMPTSSIQDIYPRLNNAEIQFYSTPQDGAHNIRVYISTNTPNLKRILYRCNKRKWMTYAIDGFVLPRPTAKVSIEAFTENLFGRHGATSTVTIAGSVAI